MHFHILSYSLFCIFHHNNVSANRQKITLIWKFFWIFFFLLISIIDKNWQNLTQSYKIGKNLPKTMLFRNIVLIFSLEKPSQLENRVVKEPCKRSTACTYIYKKFLDTLCHAHSGARKGNFFVSLLAWKGYERRSKRKKIPFVSCSKRTFDISIFLPRHQLQTLTFLVTIFLKRDQFLFDSNK